MSYGAYNRLSVCYFTADAVWRRLVDLGCVQSVSRWPAAEQRAVDYSGLLTVGCTAGRLNADSPRRTFSIDSWRNLRNKSSPPFCGKTNNNNKN